ncbi:MAG: Ubiquinone biosynthesis O-methyltransferase [Flavobacteriales bacterium]|nr:Ubiquinone biosynthesis O-methyltransferase [Flavobacteriales bacterium]NUQ15749.1 class I SAM-dependent methyltransferase [Flavobacteriales bacterium]
MTDRSFHVEPHRSDTLVRCPLCTGTDLPVTLEVKDHSISHEHFTLVDCRACGFRFTNPRPAPQHLGRYYESASYISHSNSHHSLTDRLYQLARRWALSRKHALVARFRSNGRVLDVGCGTGEFLGYLKRKGYLVTGVEPSLKAREQAIANHAIQVYPDLDQVPGSEQLHIATLWHVLEHVPDLRSTLKRLFALLAKDGLLVIAVPDRESWDAAYYGTDWAAYDVPRHLSHFRRRDLQRLVAEHGFEPVAVRRLWLDAPYIALLSERYRGRGTAGALLRGLAIGTWSNLVSAFSDKPTSSSLFLFKKASA